MLRMKRILIILSPGLLVSVESVIVIASEVFCQLFTVLGTAVTAASS